jgi:hypothetical protein
MTKTKQRKKQKNISALRIFDRIYLIKECCVGNAFNKRNAFNEKICDPFL